MVQPLARLYQPLARLYQPLARLYQPLRASGQIPQHEPW
jgi:hypothetical protein